MFNLILKSITSFIWSLTTEPCVFFEGFFLFFIEEAPYFNLTLPASLLRRPGRGQQAASRHQPGQFRFGGSSNSRAGDLNIVCVKLDPDEAKAFLKDLGVDDSGVSSLIKGTYNLLGLMTYFTAGEKEVRAWTIKKGWKAPQAAGVIHTDFEKGFIKAEIVSYDDLTRLGSVAAARDAGKYRLEGKEYVFADGDVALFRFNN